MIELPSIFLATEIFYPDTGIWGYYYKNKLRSSTLENRNSISPRILTLIYDKMSFIYEVIKNYMSCLIIGSWDSLGMEFL